MCLVVKGEGEKSAMFVSWRIG